MAAKLGVRDEAGDATGWEAEGEAAREARQRGSRLRAWDAVADSGGSGIGCRVLGGRNSEWVGSPAGR